MAQYKENIWCTWCISECSWILASHQLHWVTSEWSFHTHIHSGLNNIRNSTVQRKVMHAHDASQYPDALSQHAHRPSPGQDQDTLTVFHACGGLSPWGQAHLRKSLSIDTTLPPQLSSKRKTVSVPTLPQRNVLLHLMTMVFRKWWDDGVMQNNFNASTEVRRVSCSVPAFKTCSSRVCNMIPTWLAALSLLHWLKQSVFQFFGQRPLPF